VQDLVRRCRVTLSHEFTRDIARELGTDAAAVRKALHSGGVEKAVLPIDTIAALGAFKAKGGGVNIGRMVGVKATATASKDDAPPRIDFEFEFAWQKDAWIFLGEHCNALADVTLTKRQLALALDESTN